MALLNYSSNEALERIYKMLSASENPADAEGLLGQMPFDEALTRIAQLLEGSLGDATFDFPDVAAASDSAAGVIELADVDEANARYEDLIDTRALTPQSHGWAHESGGIFVSTGTVGQAFPQDTWTKITGAFQNSMHNSGEVSPDWNDDRLIINEVGVYLISYHLSWWTWSAATPKVATRVYVNAAPAPQTHSVLTFGSSGTVMNVSGLGVINIVTGGYAVDLRVSSSAAATIQVESAQVFMDKLPGVLGVGSP